MQTFVWGQAASSYSSLPRRMRLEYRYTSCLMPCLAVSAVKVTISHHRPCLTHLCVFKPRSPRLLLKGYIFLHSNGQISCDTRQVSHATSCPWKPQKKTRNKEKWQWDGLLPSSTMAMLQPQHFIWTGRRFNIKRRTKNNTLTFTLMENTQDLTWLARARVEDWQSVAGKWLWDTWLAAGSWLILP